jgi:dipeptidyl aminopeptidase/acylaminoacyl peptidase
MRTTRPLVVLIVGLPLIAGAQGTAADYARSDGLRRRLEGTVIGAPEQARWIENTGLFWYRTTTKSGFDYVLFDAKTLEKKVAFDQQRLASSLSAAARRTFTVATLPVNQLTFLAADSVEMVADSVRWHCSVARYVCARVQRSDSTPRPTGLRQGGGILGNAGTPDERPKPSPDGKWEATVRNHNIFIRPIESGGIRQQSAGTMLSTDGSEADAYSQQSIQWSPDSRKIAAYRVRPGFRREVHYVESSPEDQLQPKHSTLLYHKPGDVLDVERPVLFDVETKTLTVIDNTLFPNAYDMANLAWRKDGRAVTFEYNERGHQVYRVIEIDAATGKARAIIEEKMPTFFEYSAKRYRFDIGDGREIVWMSERDGWNHLYLYDGVTGRVKNQITKGPWLVRSVVKVDSVARQIYFSASGMNTAKGEDPYFVHYYRINFDGTGLTTFTDANGMHTVSFSPDMQYYVDTWSRVDLPARSQLRRTSDRSVVAELGKGDHAALLATGWRPPEVFVAKARDGKTDIWGVIIRPTNFDSTKRYPVIENIYAGPQGSFVPKTFSTQLGMQSLAEIGFIVVQIDGMGTSNRSKAFHDVAYKNLGDAGFPDRILWHKAVAAKYPYYDVSRVGIYGTSAGGQNSMGALLFHPEFYKVAVSAAGCHDNRMDKIWWNEQWMGALGPHYSASSNVDNASKLQGNLLLVVGELDRNVDPSSTMQVVNALIKANKMFDLLVIPGAGHTDGGPYGQRKRNDFFVHHLHGVEPPARNAVTASSTSSAGNP